MRLFDWIEKLFGLNMHGADRILPEFHNARVGMVAMEAGLPGDGAEDAA
jgi:hypothetical protein